MSRCFLGAHKVTIRSNLHQARGTGVRPVGSEDLSEGMAGTAMLRLAVNASALRGCLAMNCYSK